MTSFGSSMPASRPASWLPSSRPGAGGGPAGPGTCTWEWNFGWEQYELKSSTCAAGYECPYLDVNTYLFVNVVTRDCGVA